jgi:glycosyltransferase involved in cell wall biosynthesis
MVLEHPHSSATGNGEAVPRPVAVRPSMPNTRAPINPTSRPAPEEPVLILGRLPKASVKTLKGQHRVTLNIARNLPGKNSVVTLLKQGGILGRLLRWQPNHRTLDGVEFRELSLLRLLATLAAHRKVLITAGYYYGILACGIKVLTLGRLRVAHRTGGFVREERRISNTLREASGNGVFEVALEYAVLRMADQILVNSDFYSSRLQNVYPFTRGKTLLLRNGIDDSLLPNRSHKDRGDTEPVRLLSVTNLFGKKGVDILVETFRRVPAIRPIELTIVGDGLESMKNLIEASAQDASLRSQGKQIKLLSGLDNASMRKVYQESDLYLQLSRFDEGPSAVLEAYCYGLPLLLSNAVGTAPEILESRSCRICAPDPAEASRVLAEILSNLPPVQKGGPPLEPLLWRNILGNIAPALFS